MQPDPAQCPECGGEMEIGFIPDFTYGAVLPQRWSKDAPQKNWLAGVKFKRDQSRTIETYRCTSCGLLKSYAR
jgi:hypothetical protein